MDFRFVLALLLVGLTHKHKAAQICVLKPELKCQQRWQCFKEECLHTGRQIKQLLRSQRIFMLCIFSPHFQRLNVIWEAKLHK